MRTTQVKNKLLPTIKKGYKGNKLLNGRFINDYEGPKNISLPHFIAWALFDKEHRKAEDNHPRRKTKTKPLKKLPPKEKDSITWLGHAGFLITLGGKRIIIDPALTSLFPVPRKAKAPITPEGLGEVDYTLISHGHRDHLDGATLRRLRTKRILVPLGVKRIVERYNKTATTEAAGWWQRYATEEDIEIYLLPAYHWHARLVGDKDKALWGSFLIRSGKKNVFFCGDTGHTEHFKDIHEHFKRMDACIMPTTYYKPDHIMAAEHMPIEDSVKAFDTLRGDIFIPMHYGTFGLNNAGVGPTMEETKKHFKERKRKKGELRFLDIGETTYF